MDPIIIRYLIYGLVSAAIVSAAVCAPQLNQARDEIAFVKGYTHALEVHGLDAHSDDRTVWDGFKGRHGMFHADAWEQGYRRALKTHGLAWSERDSRGRYGTTRTTPPTAMQQSRTPRAPQPWRCRTPRTRCGAESRDA